MGNQQECVATQTAQDHE